MTIPASQAFAEYAEDRPVPIDTRTVCVSKAHCRVGSPIGILGGRAPWYRLADLGESCLPNLVRRFLR